MTAPNYRRAAGVVVRDEIARRGLKQDEAAEAAQVARSTLSRVIAGDPTVRPATFRAVEAALRLPRWFLDHVAAGDRAWVEASVTDPDLQRYTLDVMDEAEAEGA